MIAASMGLGVTLGCSKEKQTHTESAGAKIAKAVTSKKRPPVIWLSGQECTGCTETLLRSTHPTTANLLLDLISLDYHETLDTPSGSLAEAAKQASIKANKGKFILVTEGAIPLKDGGIYCKVGGRPIVDVVRETAPLASAIIAIGSCATWGGIPSAAPNPTGAVSTEEALEGKFKVINIPGCPPSPYNFLATVLYVLTFNKLPRLDGLGRPFFAYRRLIHEGCPRRPHFDAGRFAMAIDDEGHRRGWCLYKLGCKGPETYNNCPAILFGDVGAQTWPVGCGAPCFGCSEKDVGFTKPIVEQASLKHFTPAGMPFKSEEGVQIRPGGRELRLTPPDTYPPINVQEGHGASNAAVGVLAGLAGAAVGAGVVTAIKLGKHDETPDVPTDKPSDELSSDESTGKE